MPELAGATAVAGEVPVTSTSESTKSTSSAELESTATSTESTVESQETEGTEQKSTVTAKGDVRSMLKDPAKREALKAIDLSLPGLLRDLEYARAQVTKEFPGGLKEAVELRNAVQEIGGLEAVRETAQVVQNYDNLDELYSKGDPGFVKKIAESDPEAFSRMVPVALDTFAQMNPEMYEHVMSRVLTATINAHRFPDALQLIYSAVTDKPEAKAAVEKLWNSIESFRTLSAKVPEKKIDPERQKFEQEKQQWSSKQRQEMVESVDNDSLAHRAAVIAREWKPFGDFAGLDSEQKEMITGVIHGQIKKIVGADSGFIALRNRTIDSGDRNALAKLERDKLSEILPRIIPRVAKSLNIQPAKQGAKTTVKTGIQQTSRPQQGFIQVREQPRTIDRSRTTQEMLFKNQAILPDGRKVQWT